MGKGMGMGMGWGRDMWMLTDTPGVDLLAAGPALHAALQQVRTAPAGLCAPVCMLACCGSQRAGVCACLLPAERGGRGRGTFTP